MSKKVVKLTQEDIEKVVSNIIQENEGELDEYLFLGGDGKQPQNLSADTKLVYAAKDNDGNYYIVDAVSGKILAKDNIANQSGGRAAAE